MLYSCNKNNNVSALDYILDSNFGSVQGRGTPMKLGFGSPKKRGEDPCCMKYNVNVEVNEQ
jgi:hypothetical protein